MNPPTHSRGSISAFYPDLQALEDCRSTARLYRQAISEHSFSEPQQRILDAILRFSLDLGRYWAPFIRQGLICEVCPGLKAPKVSEELKALIESCVVDSDKVSTVVRSRKVRWRLFCINPPGRWRPRIQLREARSVVRAALLSWLERLDPHAPELIPAPPELDQLLREDFVESNSRFTNFAGSGESRVEGLKPQKSSPGESLSIGQEVGKVLPQGTFTKVLPQGTFDDPPASPAGEGVTSKVLPQGTFLTSKVLPGGTFEDCAGGPCTTRARAQIDRSIDPDRSGIPRSNLSLLRQVSDGIFCIIGENERRGASARHWLNFIVQMPETANELMEKLRQLVSENRLTSPPVRWLMRASLNAMEESQITPLPGFPKTAEDAVLYAIVVGCPEDFAKTTWEQAMARGGRDSREASIADFHYHLSCCWKYWRNRLEEKKQHGRATQNDGSDGSKSAGGSAGPDYSKGF